VKKLIVPLAAVAAALVWASVASAHAHVSPPVSLAGEGQLYSLVVPTEKEGLTTTKVVMTVPSGFGIDSFVAAPGWKRVTQSTGSGEDAVVQSVTWTGGATPTGEDSLFQFLASAKAGTYTFDVQQTYSDGSIVNWSEPESGEDPAPTIGVKSSLGGGGGASALTIVALVLGAAGVLVGGAALLSKGGRQLA
jgi:uncharacterized protein YcnI